MSMFGLTIDLDRVEDDKYIDDKKDIYDDFYVYKALDELIPISFSYYLNLSVFEVISPNYIFVALHDFFNILLSTDNIL